MKDRLITVGLAIAAFAIVYALFIPKPQRAEEEPSRPLSTEGRTGGYQVLWQWLASERIREVASRSRYDVLARRFGGAEGGNVLLASLPYENAPNPTETAELQKWVQSGNTLLVLAALDDTPAWSLAYGDRLVDEVKQLTGMKATEEKQISEKNRMAELRNGVSTLMADRSSVIEPRGVHPLLAGVRSVTVTSEFPSSRWTGSIGDDAALLDIASVQGSDDTAIWLMRKDAGQVIVIGFAGIFNNRNIATGDAGRLISNVLAWCLKPGGSLIFDDAHHGAVDYYDAKAFFADPRLHRTLLWLVALWLVFVFGIQRLRIHPQTWHAADITSFIATSGEFLASVVTPRVAAARLLANFFNGIRRRLNLPENGSAEWQWLASQPKVLNSEVQALRNFQAQLDVGKRVSVVGLHTLICQLREKLT